MTLQEFYDRTARLVKHHGDLELRILIDEPSIGPRATVGIDNVYQGIDWETNMLLIEPDQKLKRA